MSTDISRAEDDRAPTTELVTSAVGDRCVNCQAPLASEQRYCVNCGARRGKPRFTSESLAPQTSPVPVLAAERPPHHRPRVSAATTLVAGVATLLIAMGVGVLIGHNSASSPTRAAAQQIITVPGAGTSASSSPASSAATPTSGHGKHSNAKAVAAQKTKVKVVHLTPKTTKAAATAATKVLGANAPKAPTVSTGQSCTAGTPGCTNGHFTGTFFGP